MEKTAPSTGPAAYAKISSIFIYPIKSCRGISVPQAPLTPTEIKAPGMDLLNISLSKPPQAVADGVSILGWSGSALDEGGEASKWFTDFLGKPSRIVRFNAASETRPVDPMYAQGHSVMFSDQYPFMLTSQESLDAPNKLLKEPVPINRFRPKSTSGRTWFARKDCRYIEDE
ncbi:malate dehydrogenase [Hibiscus syriacus]|uniref:Malate dehydrogenase n=1 Tax=Hibiscus syriacus TaxID=106335 RepID=A0A6A2Y5N2_HIBSY|nr:malate dehydrogenase [Hibiscus syriacus]